MWVLHWLSIDLRKLCFEICHQILYTWGLFLQGSPSYCIRKSNEYSQNDEVGIQWQGLLTFWHWRCRNWWRCCRIYSSWCKYCSGRPQTCSLLLVFFCNINLFFLFFFLSEPHQTKSMQICLLIHAYPIHINLLELVLYYCCCYVCPTSKHWDILDIYLKISHEIWYVELTVIAIIWVKIFKPMYLFLYFLMKIFQFVHVLAKFHVPFPFRRSARGLWCMDTVSWRDFARSWRTSWKCTIFLP